MAKIPTEEEKKIPGAEGEEKPAAAENTLADEQEKPADEEKKPEAGESDSVGEEEKEVKKTTPPEAKPEEKPAPAPQEESEKPKDGAGEEQPAAPAGNPEEELLLARAQLAAIKGGMDAGMAEDAVVLAMHDIRKEGGTPDPASLDKAVKAVLKRHPEWGAKNDAQPGGFKVGADGTKNEQGAENEDIARAFGNKK